MARAYVCPHCGRKSRIDPSTVNDGVVACPACKAPFALPDAEESARRSQTETAVIDTRSQRAAAEHSPPSAARARLPTVIVGDAPPRPAPSRARTVLLGDHGLPSAATQPIAPPSEDNTSPSYTLPLSPSPLGVLALAVVGAAMTLAALLASPGPDPEREALTRANAGADLVKRAMLAGAPEAGLEALSALDAVALSPAGEAPAPERLWKRVEAACASRLPVPTHWLASPRLVGVLGAAPCDSDSTPERPAPAWSVKLPTDDELTWRDGGTVYARAPVSGEPTCAGCHGEGARSGAVGTVVARAAAASSAHLWFWPLIAGLGIGAAALVAVRVRVHA